MYLDQYGLPVQKDGDANDQLQRVAMILTGAKLSPTKQHTIPDLTLFFCKLAVLRRLQPKPGVYLRHVNGNANNVSADQLISILAYWVSVRNVRQIAAMLFRMLLRLGFAQNYKDGLDETKQKTKIPDFMLIRALPLYARAHWLFYPLTVLSDLWLLLASLAAVGPVFRDDTIVPQKRTPDDVDDNVIIMTLTVCRAVMPTPLSWLAAKLYAKFRPWNLGCDGVTEGVEHDKYDPVYGALRHYHRAENGGNPEIAELYKPIVERYLS